MSGDMTPGDRPTQGAEPPPGPGPIWELIGDKSTDRAVGRVLADRYRLLECIGEGGMGRVYRAEHLTLDKAIAVKVLTNAKAVPQATQRFFREAKATASIGHENIVEIIDFGETRDGAVFIVMELLDGEDLGQTLDRVGRMPWPRAIGIVVQICRALGAAHEQGIVHRDLKPENCLRLERDGNRDFIKVLDFGIAKLMRPAAEETRLTKTGSVFGTPAYMSPEQARGRHIDHRSDIYAVGIILYELLTGRVPFDGEDFLEIVLQHLHDVVPAPSTRVPAQDVPQELDAVVLKALAKNPDDRYPTMHAFASALARSVGAPEEADWSSGGFVVPWGTSGPISINDGPIPDAVQRAPAVTTPGRSHAGITEVVVDPSVRPTSTGRIVALSAALGFAVVLIGGGAWWMWGRSPEQADQGVASASPTSVAPLPKENSADRDLIDDSALQREDAQRASAPSPDHPGPADPTPPANVQAEGPPVQAPGPAPESEDPKPKPKKTSAGLLSKTQISKAMTPIASQVRACGGSLTKVDGNDSLRVELVVAGATGAVTSARVKGPLAGTAAAACALAIVKKARFPQFAAKSQRFTRRLSL